MGSSEIDAIVNAAREALDNLRLAAGDSTRNRYYLNDCDRVTRALDELARLSRQDNDKQTTFTREMDK